MTTIEFNLLDPEFRANPYPTYHRMVRECRVHYMESWKQWNFFGFEDCLTLLRSPNLGHNIHQELSPSNPMSVFEPVFQNNAKMMLFQNPPDHTRLRSLVHKAFTPRLLTKFKADMKDLTAQMLDAGEAKGEFDLMTELALPLPIKVITRLIGVPDDRADDLHRWSNAMTYILNATATPEHYQMALEAIGEYREYLTELIQLRKKNPQNDLLSELVHAEEAGEKLTHDELLANVMLLLNAGHETTVSLISSGMLALFENPEQMALLRNNLDLMPQAVEEMMRYCSPVQLNGRAVHKAFEYKGIQLEVGQSVGCMLAAANRDPEHFENPDTFDITREQKRNIGFGMGIHYCLGAPLARMEAEIAISMLLERAPNLTLVEENPTYKPSFVIRCLESLRVKM